MVADIVTLRNEFSRLDSEYAGLSGVENHLDRAKTSMDANEAKLKSVKLEAERAKKELQHLQEVKQRAQHKKVRKLVKRDKYERKVEESASKVDRQAVVADEKLEETRKIEKQQRHAADEYRTVRQMAAHRQQLLRKKREILDSLFSGSAGDYLENEQEAVVKQCLVQVSNLEADHSRLINTLRHLDASYSHLEQMISLMQKAFSNNTVDMFTGGFISIYAGLQTNQAMEQVKVHALRAEKEFQTALALCPEMPNRLVAQIRSGDFLAFANIFLDNVYTDYMVRQNIRKNMQSTVETMKIVQNSKKWIRQRLAERASERQMASTVLENAETALERERVRLLYSYQI
eukprot:Plantae.Rhodophyta-Purpureofilum_apyrenoidigerum.ctg14443.p1 GENE.Plantae.Rhodophyta-Purpureofilum_apyrenoidigerum.ctg14443~~Plantae.Rhodophyta-Purpureofilum_apyrenoidigerum.ctg14443.p1  ORF type:complete len:346 (-),score=67.56 Plantae.Rhodophyta-Purpureofilum_apyrenoidigerum.ctg14443:103-1140(-)